jgi:predicted unusual protein kinase regulating ubiquinone biosynthesis (AarF/ABC1/UbiB family)
VSKPNDAADKLRAALERQEGVMPSSRLARLWRTGRSAAGMARAVLGKRREDFDAHDVEALTALVARLGELKGITMKVGQILGYIDPSMREEVRAMLSVLQTSSQPSPFEAIEASIASALGERAPELLLHLERKPVAVASIAQVHRSELRGRAVAVKILHPGIADVLRGDFANAAAGAAFSALLMPGASATVAANIDEARTTLLEECDLALEAERQMTFARIFASDPDIFVPEVEGAFSAPTVLTSAWHSGLSLDAYLATDPSQTERDRLGLALFRFYLRTLYRHGLFHADPHPGNYAFCEDGRLVVYDYGCVRSFDEATVVAFADLVEATRRDDLVLMAAAIEAIGANRPTSASGLDQLRALLRAFFAPLLVVGPHRVEPGGGFEARGLFRDKRALMKLALPAKLLFLSRLRFGLYAVLARLGAIADWGAMESRWASEARRGRRASGDSLRAAAP